MLNQAGLSYGEFGSGTDALNGDRALDSLVTRVNAYAIHADNDHLHIHAAGLRVGKDGLIVPAHSGTGKTTLAAIFSRRGHGYLTDEAISVDLDGSRVTGFPKPLSLKESGHHMMKSFREQRVSFGEGSGSTWQIPASALGATPTREFTPTFIALLEQAGSRPGPAQSGFLHPAEAAVRVLDHVLDAKRFRGSTLQAAARLAAQCSAVRVSAGRTAEETADDVESLLSISRPTSDVDFEALPPATGNIKIAGLTIPPNLQSVRLDDRIVLFNTESRRSAALDEPGASLWLRLTEGEAPNARLPGVAMFLDQLHKEGFLEMSHADRTT